MTIGWIKLKLVGDANDAYSRLILRVESERSRGIESSLDQTLLRSIDSKLAILHERRDYGIQIPRKLIPLKYSRDYGATNLWKVDLAGYWRMIYTLRQEPRDGLSIEVIDISLDVMDIIDHKEYDRLFGYRKR